MLDGYQKRRALRHLRRPDTHNEFDLLIRSDRLRAETVRPERLEIDKRAWDFERDLVERVEFLRVVSGVLAGALVGAAVLLVYAWLAL